MINLLPEQAKLQLARDRFSRALLTAGAMLFMVTASAALMMLLTYVSLGLQKSELLRELAIAKKSPTLARVETVEEKIILTNDVVKIFLKGLERENRISHILDEALKNRPPAVGINEFTYNSPNEFRLRGSAQSRNDLLLFVERLSKSKVISGVNSPISNLLKDRDIEFELSFASVDEETREKNPSAP